MHLFFNLVTQASLQVTKIYQVFNVPPLLAALRQGEGENLKILDKNTEKFLFWVKTKVIRPMVISV